MTPLAINPAIHFNGVARAVAYDPNGHRYTAGASALDHVTGILRGVGVSVDFERLVAEGKVTAAQLEEKRALGQAAHAATHYYDDNTLVAGSVDPRVEPYLQAWMHFRQVTGFVPALLETALWHPGLLIGGTLDRAGTFTSFVDADPRDLHTVDIKLGEPDDAAARWQTAAYAEFLALSLAPGFPGLDNIKMRMRKRYSVQLLPSGHYKLHVYADVINDWLEFCAFVTTFRRQAVRRREVARV